MRKIFLYCLMQLVTAGCFAAEADNLPVMMSAQSAQPVDLNDYAQLREQAVSGDSSAQILVGLMLSEGRGVDRDIEQARRWFDKASRQGDMRAAFLLGVSYLDHEPSEFKHAVAVRLIKQAARGGNKTAQRFMAISYEKGWMSMQVNLDNANYWWQQYHHSRQQ